GRREPAPFTDRSARGRGVTPGIATVPGRHRRREAFGEGTRDATANWCAAPTSGTSGEWSIVTNGSAADTEAIISLRGVTKSFGSHTVLQDISFDIPRGKISAIMGPSGTGKSVLLKNIIGLLRPDRGEIWVDGEET